MVQLCALQIILIRLTLDQSLKKNCAVGKGDRGRTRNHYMNYTKGHKTWGINTSKLEERLIFLFSAQRLKMLYICAKFHEKFLKILKL